MIQLVQRIACAFVALLAVAPVRAQATDAETWARALVDAPHHASGDDDALAASWFEMIAREPEHPLVEATLRALNLLSLERTRDAATRIAGLEVERFQPLARGVALDLRSRWRAAAEPGELLARAQRGELFPDHLRVARVLGPLAGNCTASSARAALFAAPEFDREHAGARDLRPRWMPFERGVDDPSFTPDSQVTPEIGWAAVAWHFDAPTAAPAWIELDCSYAAGPHWLLALGSQDRDWRSATRDPSFNYAFNGAAPIAVDFLADERSLVERAPVVLRAGRNQLLLACNLGANLRFAVRVLDADGCPITVLESTSAAELGPDSGLAAPAQPLISSESYLRSLQQRGADTEALLGLLELLDGRPGAGLARVKRASDAAPERTGLRALLSEAYARVQHVPDSWKRGQARMLAEAVVGVEPLHAPMQLALARVLAGEDREEEALTKLGELAGRDPTRAAPRLELAQTHARLELAVSSERALLEALDRSTQDPDTLDAAAAHFAAHGGESRALELRQSALALDLTAYRLREFADVAASAGRIELAEASLRSALTLGGTWSERSALAEFLTDQARYDEADALFAGIEKQLPFEPWFTVRRADVARLRGDEQREVEHLREVLRRSPSDPTARARLFALTGHEPARDFEARYALDVAATLASFDATKWNDSVVRVIDSAIVYVFEDGGFQQLNHERNLVRDLQGCESQGTQRPAGEVLEIATLKASDGKRYEPVAVSGEYVMPSLEPGDSVEILQRVAYDPPADDVVRLGEWSFASVDEPFHLSRYVISTPKSLGLRLVLRNFAGEHREIDEGERVVHVFEVREHPRVLLEPASPPASWILPWLAFGRDRERDDVARTIAETSVLATRVAPEIAAAAELATQGIDSEDDRARVLHAFVAQALDKRAPGGRASALAALLTREGNGTWLYAALLDAAGIEHDVVWSRNVTPAGDGEPEPAFVDANRWMRKSFVLVKPGDAPEAWCDMSSRTLPYGVVVADAPGASAFAVRQRAWIEMPDVPMHERVGQRQTGRFTLDGARGAAVELAIGFTGNLGHALKERFRDVPNAQRKAVVQSFANSIVPGIDVAEFDLPGIDGDSEPLSFSAKGAVKSFLDESGGELACKLPFTALQLTRLASGEGERKHPFFLPQSTADAASARFELPEGWRLAREFTSLVEDFRGGTYRLVLEPDGERAFTLRRELYLPPMVLEPAAYPDFVAFAKRVDEAERARLVFAKPE